MCGVFIERKISEKKKVCNGHVTVAKGRGGEGSSQRSYDRWAAGGRGGRRWGAGGEGQGGRRKGRREGGAWLGGGGNGGGKGGKGGPGRPATLGPPL